MAGNRNEKPLDGYYDITPRVYEGHFHVFLWTKTRDTAQVSECMVYEYEG